MGLYLLFYISLSICSTKNPKVYFKNIVIIRKYMKNTDSKPLCRSKISNLSYSFINKGIKFIYIMWIMYVKVDDHYNMSILECLC